MTADETNLPWVEKFRPATLKEVSGQEETIEILSKTIKSNNLPHLLFYGVPGSGKTSTILAMAKDLFGDLYKQRVLELNASDQRGIEVIRTKVKNFAQVSINGKGPSFKLIILDEADSMTADAQAALRRTMETWSHVTRFCLICNYLTRIIEPLASRCAKFRFKPLPADLIVERLEFITRQEGMNCQRQVYFNLI
jgi:replication factor C subunit 2/4